MTRWAWSDVRDGYEGSNGDFVSWLELEQTKRDVREFLKLGRPELIWAWWKRHVCRRY
jgi:hypothetical protein